MARTLNSYMKTLFRDKMVASVVPSTRFSVRRALQHFDFGRNIVVVEYGPGNGVFTQELLRRMSPQSKLIAFETNGDLVHHLQRTISDPRFTLVHGSAEDVGLHADPASVNYVLSGIPFSMIPHDTKSRIISETHRVLAPRGRFVTYQMFPPSAKTDRHLLPAMRERFSIDRVEYELRNIPPLRFYVGAKRETVVQLFSEANADKPRRKKTAEF